MTGRVDEPLELGELHDLVEDLVDETLLEAEDRGVEVDVFPAGEIGLEAGPEFEQSGQSADSAHRAARRLEDAGHALQQRRLARAVVAEQPHRGAGLDGEADVVESLKRFVRHPTEVDQALLGRGVLLSIELERFRDVLDLDGGGHDAYSSSVKLPSSRRNTDKLKVKSSELPTITNSRFLRYHQNGN